MIKTATSEWKVLFDNKNKLDARCSLTYVCSFDIREIDETNE